MITLDNVTLLKPGIRNRTPILLEANATFGPRERVGILAAPGSGKSSLARLFAGIEGPDRGTVRRDCRVSWPIGFAGFLHPNLSVGSNLTTFARMMGLSPEQVIGFCEDFCEDPFLAGRKMQDLSPTRRALLGYACSVSVPGPAIWVADEIITIGEPQDRARCDEVLEERLQQGGLVFLSRNVRQLQAYCDRFLVLIDQRLVDCQDLGIAQEALKMSAKRSAAQAKLR